MVSQNNDERGFIRKSKHGDGEAFGKLVGKYKDKIYSLCYHMLLHREDAEEAAQEVWLRAYKKIREFREKSKFYTWLRKIAINYCIDVRRSRRGQGIAVPMSEYESDDDTVSLAERIPSPNGDPHKAYIKKENKEERQKCIERLLAALNPDQRAVVELRHFEELSYEEVAEILNRPIGTIKSQRERAFDKLREKAKECRDEKQKYQS